jgi:hypothetical protein
MVPLEYKARTLTAQQQEILSFSGNNMTLNVAGKFGWSWNKANVAYPKYGTSIFLASW